MNTTLVKGLALLARLATEAEPQGVSELSRALSIAKGNVHALLKTLIEQGYVRQDPASSRYTATHRLWELGAVAGGNDPFRRAARPYLRALHEETGETVFLAMLDGSDVLHLDRIEGSQPLRPSATPRIRVPAIFPASGKILLALHPDPRPLVDQAIAGLPATLAVNSAVLLEELAEARQEGFATSFGGRRDNMRYVAAPILDREGMAVASIGVGGPGERIDDARFQAITTLAIQAAGDVAAALGYGADDYH